MRAPLALASAAAALVVALAACASAPPIADPNGPYAQGERIYRSHCAACHRLRAPSSETRARWAWAVEKYGPRAKVFGDDRAEVLAFLQAYAKDAPPPPPPPAAPPTAAPPAPAPPTAPAPVPAPEVKP